MRTKSDKMHKLRRYFFIIKMPISLTKAFIISFLNLPWYTLVRFIRSISEEIDIFYKAKQTYRWILRSFPLILASLCLSATISLRVIS